MKLIIHRHPNLKKEVEGTEARQVLREVLTAIGENILLPIPAAKRKVRTRAVQALQAGRPIWSESDEMGNASRDATILIKPVPIVGIIKEDGTYEEVGETKPTPIPGV